LGTFLRCMLLNCNSQNFVEDKSPPLKCKKSSQPTESPGLLLFASISICGSHHCQRRLSFNVTYNVSIYLAAEMLKPLKKWTPIPGFLSSSRFEKKILSKVVSLAKLVIPPDSDEFTLCFSVPCQVKNSAQLGDVEKYEHMIASACKSEDPSASILFVSKKPVMTD
jgi:hypothetical protein